MFTASDVTLYVPAFQAHETLCACINAVAKQTIKPARTIVVDDGSSPPVQIQAAEILRHDSNRGLAASRNTALAACQTRLIAALDSDVVPEPDWLEHMLAAMNSSRLAGVGGRLLEASQDTIADQWRARHMAQHWGDATIRNPRFLFGANTLFQTQDLRAADGYNPNLRTNNEDRTICDKLYSLGRNLLYTPDARANHLRRDSAFSILRGYWKWHHAKGLLRGDFNSLSGILNRITEVNFGIFKYRFDLDQQSAKHCFLAIDAAIPWMFSYLDLAIFHQRTGQLLPVFPSENMLKSLPKQIVDALTCLMPIKKTGVTQSNNETEYHTAFAKALAKADWLNKALAPSVPWAEFSRELCNENRAD